MVCSNTRADVMSVPVAANPHVKRYLHVLDMLTHQDVEGEVAGTGRHLNHLSIHAEPSRGRSDGSYGFYVADGHCVPQSPASPLESGMRASLTIRTAVSHVTRLDALMKDSGTRR